MHDHITIHGRFCGPPDSGNGGYVCGLLAGYVDSVAEVMLRKPPPLERELDVVQGEDSMVLLKDGDSLVAQARPAMLDLAFPEPVSYAQAKAAAERYIGFHFHAFPTCFVCGPRRSAGDGLRIFPGPVAGTALVASPWIPDASLADEAGYVKREFLWACLDCPGAFAVIDTLPVVLGKLTADITGRVLAGQRCVVMGWKIGAEGRKLHAGTAVFSQEGELLGKARAVWIELGNLS